MYEEIAFLFLFEVSHSQYIKHSSQCSKWLSVFSPKFTMLAKFPKHRGEPLVLPLLTVESLMGLNLTKKVPL